MSHMLLVTTVLDSAKTGLSQKVLLDNASRATGLWVVVLGVGSRPLQLPENRAGPGEVSQGSGSWQTHPEIQVPLSFLVLSNTARIWLQPLEPV